MGDADSGSSLIEVVVGISLLGLVFIGVVDASWTTTRVAAETRHRSIVSSLLAEAEVSLARTEYSACPHLDSAYAKAIANSPTEGRRGLDLTITGFEYWDHATNQWLTLDDVPISRCSTDLRLTGPLATQRITVTVLDSTGPSASARFVKTPT